LGVSAVSSFFASSFLFLPFITLGWELIPFGNWVVGPPFFFFSSGLETFFGLGALATFETLSVEGYSFDSSLAWGFAAGFA